MATILKVRLEWTVDGVLTAPDATPTLSDSTATYGIRKTGGVNVIAAATAMVLVSTGVYEYDFTEANGAEYGQAYMSWIKVTYGGVDYYFDEDHEARTSDDDLAMTVSFSSLQETIGRVFFGKRSGFSPAEAADINDIIKTGLQSVYRAHQWSFLRPTKSIVTEADENTYDLPTGYDGIVDNLLTWPEGEGYYSPLPIVPWSDIRRKVTQDDTTARPLCAAIVAAEYDATAGSKRQIVFWPTPNAAYTLSAEMRLRWTMIDAGNPYPIGGEIVADAITEACLAAAERFLDGAPGVHAEAFNQALAAAIFADKEATSPPTLGQDGGPVDLSGRQLSRAYDMGAVTFNGDTM